MNNRQNGNDGFNLVSAILKGLHLIFGENSYIETMCRYGENAWQKSTSLFTFKENSDLFSMDKFKLLAGDPGGNNWCDIDRAMQTITHIVAGYLKNFRAAGESAPYIALGLKHGNACGCGVSKNDTVLAVMKMLKGDPISIFGGTVVLNFHVTKEIAEILRNYNTTSGKRVLDIVVAPSFEEGALEILGRKDDKCKIFCNENLCRLSVGSLDTATRMRYVRGGFIAQPNYTFVPDLRNAEKSGEAADDSHTRIEMEIDAIIAWAIGSTSNSNTITIVKDCMLLANAVGQQDRVGAVDLALYKVKRAGHDCTNGSAYSDSFFPFPDAPELLVLAGIAMILTTTGSVRDNKMKEACEKILLYTYPDADARGFAWH